MSEQIDIKDMLAKGIPFIGRTGVKAISLGKGGIDLMMPLEPNTNHVGSMYAGALFTLGELMGGAVAMVYFMDHKLIPIVKGLNIKFTKFAKSDITASYAMTEEEVQRVIDDCKEKGKANFEIELELKDKDGQVVATTHGFYQVRGSW